MGMDPMVMAQGMFNNFGGPGMMNGMNMGMGFDAGQGGFDGGFNGQQQGAWNSGGQNKFNQNSYGGGANYAANTGYDAGYNMPPHQGNFNQMHYSQNDFHQHGYHNQGFHRGRGRGRGGYAYSARGRGNFHQVNQNHNANNPPSSQQIPQGPVRRGSPEYTPMNGETEDVTKVRQNHDEPSRDEFAPGDAEDRAEEEAASRATDKPAVEAPSPKEYKDHPVPTDGDEKTQEQDNLLSPEREPKSAVDDSSVAAPFSPTKPPRAHAPAGSLDSFQMPPPPSPSVPTGPSRQFTKEYPTAIAPNLGRGHEAMDVSQEQNPGLHGRRFTRIPNGEVTHSAPLPAERSIIPPAEPKGLGVVGAPTGPKAMRHGSVGTAIKPDPGFSIVGRASATRNIVERKSRLVRILQI